MMSTFSFKRSPYTSRNSRLKITGFAIFQDSFNLEIDSFNDPQRERDNRECGINSHWTGKDRRVHHVESVINLLRWRICAKHLSFSIHNAFGGTVSHRATA